MVIENANAVGHAKEMKNILETNFQLQTVDLQWKILIVHFALIVKITFDCDVSSVR